MSIHPTPDQYHALSNDIETSGRITMLNLLRFHIEARYASNFPTATACSGRQAYERYIALVAPLLLKYGGKLLVAHTVKQTVIAPSSEEWDEVLFVEYPSRKAFFTMISSKDYQSIVPHRTAALADSRLILTVAPRAAL